MKARPNRLGEIQTLRAAAAGLVALGHSLDWCAAAGCSSLPSGSWSSLGACGVDLFFVISGFIIAKTALEPDPSPEAGDFLLRRAIRILPCYWLWSLAALSFSLMRGFPVDSASLFKTFAFFSTADQGSYAVPVLYAGWTLSYELLFYLMVGVLLMLRLRSAWVPVGLALGLSGLSLTGTGAPYWERFLANPLWLEFAAGVLLWRFGGKLQSLPRLLGLGMILCGLMLLGLSLPFTADLADIQKTVGGLSTWLRVAHWGGAAVLIAAGALVCGDWLAARTRALGLLGDASYSWYLTQLLVIPAAARLWRLFWPSSPWQSFAVFGLALTAGFAVLARRLLEKPLHDGLLSRLGKANG